MAPKSVHRHSRVFVCLFVCEHTTERSTHIQKTNTHLAHLSQKLCAQHLASVTQNTQKKIPLSANAQQLKKQPKKQQPQIV